MKTMTLNLIGGGSITLDTTKVKEIKPLGKGSNVTYADTTMGEKEIHVYECHTRIKNYMEEQS